MSFIPLAWKIGLFSQNLHVKEKHCIFGLRKGPEAVFLSSLSLFTPRTELCRFEFETKVKTLKYYNIQWEYKTSSLKIASFNTLGI